MRRLDTGRCGLAALKSSTQRGGVLPKAVVNTDSHIPCVILRQLGVATPDSAVTSIFGEITPRLDSACFCTMEATSPSTHGVVIGVSPRNVRVES